MDKLTLIFSGNPKAGSTWLGGLLAGISIEMGLNIFYGQYSLDNNYVKIKNGQYDIIISQSSNYEKLQNLSLGYKGVHVIRDPRDVCISSYFSFKKTHDIENWVQLGSLRKTLNNLDFHDGMLEIFKFNEYFFDQLNCWNYEDSNFLELKYEEIIFNPEESVLHICEFLGLDYTLLSSNTQKVKRSGK